MNPTLAQHGPKIELTWNYREPKMANMDHHRLNMAYMDLKWTQHIFWTSDGPAIDSIDQI